MTKEFQSDFEVNHIRQSYDNVLIDRGKNIEQ